jgi:hypothetical protein
MPLPTICKACGGPIPPCQTGYCANIAADETELERDVRLYEAATMRMQHGEIGDAEFQAAWKQLEEVKNRHGGMPPKIIVK